MCEIKCESCLEPVTVVWLFRGKFYEDDEIVEEIYCQECMANILREDPAAVISITRVEESF